MAGDVARREGKILNGTHPFVGPGLNKRKIENGTHIFLDPEFIKNQAERTSKRLKEKVKNGTHHFLGGEIARRCGRERVRQGTHHFITCNPGKIEWTCPYCKKSGKGKSNLTRHQASKNCTKFEFQEVFQFHSKCPCLTLNRSLHVRWYWNCENSASATSYL